jgi:hypothetical protein
MVLNSLFPVFVMILFGSLLKRWRLTDEVFLKTADKLAYYIFFPALLFWKIGGASAALSGGTGLYKPVIWAVFTVYVLSTLLSRFTNWRPEPENRPDILYAADFTGPVYPVLAAQQRYQPGIGFDCAVDDSVVYIPVDCAADLKCASVSYCYFYASDDKKSSPRRARSSRRS